jgi:hypothetical protein
VLVALGAAVAKTAFKAWTGDNTLADNVSDELTDLIAGKVSDARDRHKVANRFANIAEIVGDRIADTMREEFRGLPEGEKNAAVIAVTETLARADLSNINEASKAVVAASLDAATLERSVRRFTRGSTKNLSADGTAFYYLVLSQCCASIAEIADKLPSFQSDAFAMLLSNDRTILERIEEVLTRLPMPSQQGAGVDEVEVDYRRVLAKDFDRLELFGLDFAAQWYPLSIAYVNLTMSARQQTANGPASGDVSGDGPGADAITGPGERTFEHWLHACPRLLIEGRAGGGKTTLLQWVAVRAALRDFPGVAAAYNGYVPFYVRLRGYAGRPLPTPAEFLDSAAPALTPEAGTWPSQCLRDGKALVLVDGLDEVPEGHRHVVLAWLEQLTGAFPKARYIVTTRPGAIEPGALAREGFVPADLEPMTPGLVRLFVNRWHDAMRGFQQDTAAMARLHECHARLLRTLDNDRFLGELANTPLLAGLICALNQHLDGELPRRRGEIYEEALKMFHQRDRKRDIPADLSLDLDATNHLLSDLALWMVRNARAEVDGDGSSGSLVTTDSARTVLSQSALSLPSRPQADADLYKHLLLRSGVLREPAAGHVDFVHRTFQEYLAAKALIRTDSVNELAKNADDDQWREIVILASGLGITRQTSELLRGLVRQGWLGRQRYGRRLLAVACLDEIRDIDPAVLKQVTEAIPELLPPRNMDQAEALSHAGDRLIQHLAKVSYSAFYHHFVIRAAALTGGPEALNLLADMARRRQTKEGTVRTRLAANNEFLRAWSYFDPERYAELVIATLGTDTVEPTDMKVLRGLAKAPTVRHVVVNGSFFPDDGEPDRQAIEDVEGSAVDEITLAHMSSETLSGTVGDWPSIRKLGLRFWFRLNEISAITRLRNLEELEIVECLRLDVQLVEYAEVSGAPLGPFLSRDSLLARLMYHLPLLRSITIGNIDFRPSPNGLATVMQEWDVDATFGPDGQLQLPSSAVRQSSTAVTTRHLRLTLLAD